jgi:hypothetical protein
MKVTYQTAALADAERGIRIYNHGLYGYVKNPDLDERARQMFSGGLGSTSQDILRQVEFIGKDYGGAAGFKAAYSLAPEITQDIFENRAIFVQTIQSAKPILLEIPSRESIKILYAPFTKHIHGKSNWLVWANKFWHHLKPDTFPIEDRFVDAFFKINDSPSVEKYMKFLEKFRGFVLMRREFGRRSQTATGGRWNMKSCRAKLRSARKGTYRPSMKSSATKKKVRDPRDTVHEQARYANLVTRGLHAVHEHVFLLNVVSH